MLKETKALKNHPGLLFFILSLNHLSLNGDLLQRELIVTNNAFKNSIPIKFLFELIFTTEQTTLLAGQSLRAGKSESAKNKYYGTRN